MKLLAAFILTLFSFNCHSQDLVPILEKLLPQYSSKDEIKEFDSSNVKHNILFTTDSLSYKDSTALTLRAEQSRFMEKLSRQYPLRKGAKPVSFKHLTTIRVATFSSTVSLTDKWTGTKDSDQGELTHKGKLINYDIGFSSGAHINIQRKKECIFYSEEVFNGYFSLVGLMIKDGKTQLLITIWGDTRSAFKFPANFWGYIENKQDIKAMLEIASTYQPLK